jgi:ribosomal protein S18 acetylase RimI-like enzyme
MPVADTYLRPATLADLPLIVGLDRAIFGVYGADEDPAIIGARLAVFPAGCFVAVSGDDESSLLGYVTTEKWHAVREPALDEDPYTTHQAAGRVLNITTLAVSPAQHNRGLGTRLLAQVLAIARGEGCTQIVLETAHAAGFYRRHGFRQIGERTQRGIRLAIMQIDL